MESNLTVKQCEKIAEQFYPNAIIEYSESFGGDQICLFDDDVIQGIYDDKFAGHNIYNHLVTIIFDEDHDEDEWLAFYIIENIDTKQAIILVTEFEDTDSVLQYAYMEDLK